MSKKRSEALKNLLLSYYELEKFRLSVSSGSITLINTGNSETDLSKLLGFFKSSYYMKFIKQNFIDQPINGNKISLKAIDEIVNNIKLFIESTGGHPLQPINEISTSYPYTLFERLTERITSTFEAIFTTQQISPTPMPEEEREESIQHINDDMLNNTIVNHSENNNANQNDNTQILYTQDPAINCEQYLNMHGRPEETSPIAQYSASSLSDFPY